MECGLPAHLDAPNHSISFDADTIAKALVNIYQKKYGNGSPDIEPTLFEKTKEILSGAVDKGVAGQRSGKTSDAFIHALTHSTDVFSAFRIHNMQSKIASYLVDSKGKLKPFGQFVKDVKPYITHQNRQWLQTEYDTAVRRAHLAADWQRFEDEKDVLPNLEWKPSTSPNPGEDHKPYWGTILPVDHEFWNQHRPGDRWNCKCSLRNTDKQRTAIPVEHFYKNTGPQKGLDSNPGTTGEIFSTSHPYFPENCGVCPFNKGVGKLFAALVEKKGNCYKCNKIPSENFDIIKAKWNMPFSTPEEFAQSPMGGFNLIEFEENVSNQITNIKNIELKEISNPTRKISLEDGNVKMQMRITGVLLERQFGIEKANGKTIKVAIHDKIWSFPKKHGIGSIVTNELLKQYEKMGIDLIRIPDAVIDGGYVWAKMGFYTKDVDTVKQCINDILESKIDDKIKKRCKEAMTKYKADFPLQEIAFEETKDFLNKYKWHCFLNMKEDSQVERLKKYLNKEMKKIEFQSSLSSSSSISLSLDQSGCNAEMASKSSGDK